MLRVRALHGSGLARRVEVALVLGLCRGRRRRRTVRWVRGVDLCGAVDVFRGTVVCGGAGMWCARGGTMHNPWLMEINIFRYVVVCRYW